MYRQWGGDIINMSVIPEAKLAREAELEQIIPRIYVSSLIAAQLHPNLHFDGLRRLAHRSCPRDCRGGGQDSAYQRR
jgi:hypothetical protein